MTEIYFDNAATTPVRQEVIDRMSSFYSAAYGNPSSLHQTGLRAKRVLEESRHTVASALGSQAGEIYFTSGGTESNNLAIKGAAQALRKKGRHIITSAIEHHAVLNVCHALEQEGFEITLLPVTTSGIIDLDALHSSIRPDTILVSIMLANNETGAVQPVSKVSEITRERGILLHTDACQAVGKIPVKVNELGVDLLSAAAHKFYGPKGEGFLFVKKEPDIKPLLNGGSQERGLRPGTQNVPGIAGMAEALKLAVEGMPFESKRLAGLRDRLEQETLGSLHNARLNGHKEMRIPNISNMSFASVDGETLLLALDTKGISVSTGSACSADSTEPSHVLLAMGLDPNLAAASLRFSLGIQNTDEEVELVVNALKEIIEMLTI